MGITVINKATGEAYTGGRGAATPAVSAGEKKTGGKQEYKSGGVTLTVTEQVEKRQNSYAPERKNETPDTSFWERAWNTVKGGVKGSAASATDASRALYEMGNEGRRKQNEQLLAEYTHGLERARLDLESMLETNAAEPGYWRDDEIQTQRDTLAEWQRKVDAVNKILEEDVNERAVAAAAQLADQVQQNSQGDIERAKEGLGAMGQFAVDVGAAGTQLAGDMLANLLVPGAGTASLGYRAFGSGSQQARQSGAALDKQLAYGAGSAALSMAVEKIANVAKPFRKAFGAGVLDDAITKATGKLSQSAAGKIALSALAEGGEEFVEAVLQPVLQRATYDPEASFDLGEALYQAAIGAALGGVVGGVDAATSRKVGGTPQNTPPNAAASRETQSEGVDTTRSESPAEVPAAPFAQAVSAERTAPAQDTLLASIVKSMQPVTNKQAEALLADAESAVQLGIDTNGMTRSQQRAAVKEKVRQMQLTTPGKEIYKRPDPLTQILFGQEEIAAPASYDAYDNDGPFGDPARFLADISRPGVKNEPGAGTVGAAAAGFETPGSQSEERTSRLAETATPYTMREGEATARTRQEYDEMFRYRSQTEEQSMQAARNMLYLLVDGQETFLLDYDPESYEAITESLREAPAWNGVMTDAAMLIKQQLMGRSIDGTVSEETYVEWLQVMREHATAGGQGTQAWAKWSRTDNGAGQSTEAEAWDNLEDSSLSEEERRERFRAIVMFDREIEAAQTDEDLKRIILDIARQRGTLSGLTGRQSGLLTGIASRALDTLDHGQLRQFAYASSAALSTDANGANLGQKAKTVQILNMLSNPKTPAKNLAGNTSFYALDAVTMRGAALLDMALSRITGTRSVAMEGSVLGRESREAISRAIQMSLAEVTMDVDMGSGNRYQHSSNRTFKAGGTGVLNTNTAADRFAERVLSALERNMGYLMTTTDEAYKGAARSTAAATQRLVDEGKIQNAGRDYAREQAEGLAHYRTFQNRGKLATAIQTIHDVFNIIGFGDSGRTLGRGESGVTIHSFGLGDLVAPFTRVAGNLAAVGLDYSPVNAVKGTVEILDTVRRAAGGSVDPARQAKAVSDFARGMSGSAIAYGVMVLAKAGLIKRAEDEEDEDVAALNQSEGMTGTQVNIDAAQRWLSGGSQKWQPGDTLIDMSNLEPLNFILSLGVEMADNGNDGLLSTFGDVKTYQDTAAGAVAAAGDLPILSGVGDFARDVMVYHNDPVEAGVEMLGKTAISSVTPNILAAFAKGWDEKQRNVYSGDGVEDVLLDTIKSRIPGLREQLPTTVNILGEEKDNPGTLGQRLLNAMLNPIGVNEYSQSEVSREMERVREETGQTGFYPTTRKPDKLSWKDEEGKTHEVALDYEQQQRFQAACSAVQMSMTAEMIGSGLYKRADEGEQAALLKRCYDYAYQQAKAGVLGDEAVDGWVVNARKARQDLGISTADFLFYYEKYGSGVMGGSGYDKTRRMVEAGLSIDQWAAMKNKVDADGNGSVKKAEVTAYIEANFPREKWSSLFDAYKGGSNWKNPY